MTLSFRTLWTHKKSVFPATSFPSICHGASILIIVNKCYVIGQKMKDWQYLLMHFREAGRLEGRMKMNKREMTLSVHTINDESETVWPLEIAHRLNMRGKTKGECRGEQYKEPCYIFSKQCLLEKCTVRPICSVQVSMGIYNHFTRSCIRLDLEYFQKDSILRFGPQAAAVRRRQKR